MKDLMGELIRSFNQIEKSFA